MSALSRILLSIAVFAVFAVVAVPSGGRAAEIRYVDAESAITIEGSIANGDDAKFAALLDRRPHNLVIRSGGGHQVPAIAIAREVHARGMTVIVDGFCASACAQIIFPAAAERRIRRDSFVAFHDGNLAAIQAVRAELARETALMEASAAPASAAEGDARRAAIEQFLARSENQIDTISVNQVAFDAEMKLDPAVTAFYLRLTALRDIHVVLRPGDPQPVRVGVGRRGICEWWVPDRDGLARLGLTLRNAYDVPSPAAVATAAHTTPDRLYFGPPIAADDPRLETLCPAP